MYLRADHAELDPEILCDFVQSYPLGILTTAIKHEGQPTIQTSRIPWVLDFPGANTDHGVLRGHLARNNPQAKALIAAAKEAERSGSILDEVLILFSHPAASAGYVTPQWYTDTKPKTGKVVPTWNYNEVHAYGTILVHHSTVDPIANAFLTKQISDLTEQQEAAFSTTTGGEQWKVSDAPAPYINSLQKAIIGVEISITKLAGRFKMSQESSEADRKGVIEGFESLEPSPGSSQVAAMVYKCGLIKDQRKASAQKR